MYCSVYIQYVIQYKYVFTQRVKRSSSLHQSREREYWIIVFACPKHLTFKLYVSYKLEIDAPNICVRVFMFPCSCL